MKTAIAPALASGWIRSPLRFWLAAVLTWLLTATPPSQAAAFTPPPIPAAHVTDQTGSLTPQTVSQLNREAAEVERSTSSQVLAVVMSRIPEGTTLEEFCAQTFQAWKVGAKGKDNGAVLFLFTKDRKLRIEVGYGLEGAIPDATAKRIIEELIVPRLRNGDVNGGVRSGFEALLRAARGEPYRGVGRTVAEQRRLSQGSWGLVALLACWLILVMAGMRSRRRHGGTILGRRGSYSPNGSIWFDLGGGGGGGGFSDGGGFSGGGGRSGGGGASGSW